MYIVLFVILLGLLPANTNAADWKTVSSTGDFIILVDIESIVTSSGKTKAWSKWISTRPDNSNSATPSTAYQSIISLTAYRCADRTFLDLQAVAFADKDAMKRVQESSYPDYPSRYQSPLPETTGEALLLFVCKAANPSQK